MGLIKAATGAAGGTLAFWPTSGKNSSTLIH